MGSTLSHGYSEHWQLLEHYLLSSQLNQTPTIQSKFHIYIPLTYTMVLISLLTALDWFDSRYLKISKEYGATCHEVGTLNWGANVAMLCALHTSVRLARNSHVLSNLRYWYIHITCFWRKPEILCTNLIIRLRNEWVIFSNQCSNG